jgi:hypothetical protein
MPAKHKKIKLQLAGQQTLPFVRKTTKDVDNENLENTNTGSDICNYCNQVNPLTLTPQHQKNPYTIHTSLRNDIYQCICLHAV